MPAHPIAILDWNTVFVQGYTENCHGMYEIGYNVCNMRMRGVEQMEYTQDVKNRLKRLEGQIRGIIRMMEEGDDCKDVVTQLSAVRSAVDRAIGLVVAKNLETCIRDAQEKGASSEEAIKEAVDMIVKSR